MYHGCSRCYLAAIVTGSCTAGGYSAAPFASWYCNARTILFIFFHRDVYCSLFCDHGLGFRKMSLCENIVITNSSIITQHAEMQGGKPAGHDSSALASAEEDGFNPIAAHPCKSLVVRNTILLTFATPIRSRQAVSPS